MAELVVVGGTGAGLVVLVVAVVVVEQYHVIVSMVLPVRFRHSYAQKVSVRHPEALALPHGTSRGQRRQQQWAN